MTGGPITLIAGPTASGKSALALALAERCGAHIINTDSMQVYDVLSVLTARPAATDLARAPHHLYGHVSPLAEYSTGQWTRDVAALLPGLPAGVPLVFTGGTGLYFRALTEGLAPMPAIPAAVRDQLRQRLAEQGARALHDDLRDRDPGTAGMLAPNDGQRIVRALEVLTVSGRSIRDWQAEKSAPLIDPARIVACHLIEPDRRALHARIEARFDQMVAGGALDEVRQFLALEPGPGLPAMKAIGVRQLAGVLRGETDIDQAIVEAKVATRRYAKRQMTWFRHQAGPQWQRLVDISEFEKTAEP